MSKIFTLVIVFAFSGGIFISSALADNVGTADNTTAAPTTDSSGNASEPAGLKVPIASDATVSPIADAKGTPNAGTSAAKAKSQALAHRASVPKIIFGVISGIIVGTPVCAVRATIDEDKFAITDMTGGNNNKKDVKSAGIFWAPFSAVAGVLQSPFVAVNNSLVHYDQPFSPQQFSLKQRTGSYVKELKNEQKYEPEHRDIEVNPDSSKPPSNDLK